MTKCKFVNAKSGTKKADKSPFYIITVLIGDEVLQNFVDGETFKRIIERKPEFLKDYNAEFEQRVIYGKLQSVMVDMK